MTRKEDDEDWLSPVMKRTLDLMQSRDLVVTGFRDRKGHLRYILSNNEIVHPQTIRAMKERGLLEMIEPTTEQTKATGEVHYRLRKL